MADVVVLGTAAADVVVRVDQLLVPGDHLSARCLGWRLGGGSANLACGVAAAGHRVEFVGPFGNDATAGFLREQLHARGVLTGRSFDVEAPTACALILLDPSGERTILGLDRELATAAYPLAEPPEIGRPDGVWIETYTRFPTDVAERAGDALLVVPPPAGPVDHWPADIVIGSEQQFPAGWASSPFAAARGVAGPRLRWVVVTRGASGADAYGEHDVVHVDAVRAARQVDATGAGDAFAAALLSGLLDGRDMEQAMRAGAAAGAAAIEVLQSVPPGGPGDGGGG